MDISIIDAAPERARSAKKRPSPSALLAQFRSCLVAAHRWLTACDDLNTYRLCGALFCTALILVLWGYTHG